MTAVVGVKHPNIGAKITPAPPVILALKAAASGPSRLVD